MSSSPTSLTPLSFADSPLMYSDEMGIEYCLATPCSPMRVEEALPSHDDKGMKVVFMATPCSSRMPAAEEAVQSQEDSTGMEIVPAAAQQETPSTRPTWLPEGFKQEEQVRSNGATAGMKDKYYIHLKTGRKFRSQREVKRYLGMELSPRKPRSKSRSVPVPAAAACVEGESSEGKGMPDFENPKAVTWLIRKTSTGAIIQTPYVDGVKVPDEISRAWAEETDRILFPRRRPKKKGKKAEAEEVETEEAEDED